LAIFAVNGFQLFRFPQIKKKIIIMELIKKLFRFAGDVDKKTSLAVNILGWVLLVFFWWLIPTLGWIKPTILPSPIDVIMCYKTLFVERNLLFNTGYSIFINLGGYLQAMALAIPLGFLIGLIPFFRHLVSKQIEAIRFTPLPATTGIFMALFGLGLGVKVEFLAFGIFVYLLPAIAQRIKDIETDDHLKALKQTMWTLNASPWMTLKHFYIPSVLSRFSMDVINLVAVSWTYIVIAEMVNAQGGLGSMIYMATSRGSHVDQLYAVLLLIIFIGFVQDKLLKLLDKKLFKFKYA
jgi:NitT/TauT family transport system permease protein